jgi:hypothetical protein
MFLSLNMTRLSQPMDKEVIATFKSKLSSHNFSEVIKRNGW